jgi:hypothetical protein
MPRRIGHGAPRLLLPGFYHRFAGMFYGDRRVFRLRRRFHGGGSLSIHCVVQSHHDAEEAGMSGGGRRRFSSYTLCEWHMLDVSGQE